MTRLEGNRPTPPLISLPLELLSVIFFFLLAISIALFSVLFCFVLFCFVLVRDFGI